jgi:hypothetical protein
MLLAAMFLVGVAGLVAGGTCLALNARELRTRWSRGSRETIVVALLVGVALAATLSFVSYPFGTYWAVRGVPFPTAGPGYPSEFHFHDCRPSMIALNALFGLVLPQIALWLAWKPAARPAPRAHPSRHWSDYVLLIGTFVGVVLYLPLASTIVAVTHVRAHTVDDVQEEIVLTGPPVLMILCLLASVVWVVRRGSTVRSRLVWALLLSGGLLGWPWSCLIAAVRSHQGPWIGH